jgi:hypothetical protein
MSQFVHWTPVGPPHFSENGWSPLARAIPAQALRGLSGRPPSPPATSQRSRLERSMRSGPQVPSSSAAAAATRSPERSSA